MKRDSPFAAKMLVRTTIHIRNGQFPGSALSIPHARRKWASQASFIFIYDGEAPIFTKGKTYQIHSCEIGNVIHRYDVCYESYFCTLEKKKEKKIFLHSNYFCGLEVFRKMNHKKDDWTVSSCLEKKFDTFMCIQGSRNKRPIAENVVVTICIKTLQYRIDSNILRENFCGAYYDCAHNFDSVQRK